MVGQSSLYEFEADQDLGEEGECAHEDTREYVLSGKHFDGYRERRVYCRGCNSVTERERLPLEALPEGGGLA